MTRDRVAGGAGGEDSLGVENRLMWLAVLGLVLSCVAPVSAGGTTKSRVDVRRGETFPNLHFGELIAPEDYTNLGLPQTAGAFSLAGNRAEHGA